ncbi:hypothetical protein N431DRAFT_450381 [Stipitochalara longipes BDJ]|nr:hypothetical protein N431DRAFT_450381 [Stipitochalara longipes BDJ]
MAPAYSKPSGRSSLKRSREDSVSTVADEPSGKLPSHFTLNVLTHNIDTAGSVQAHLTSSARVTTLVGPEAFGSATGTIGYGPTKLEWMDWYHEDWRWLINEERGEKIVQLMQYFIPADSKDDKPLERASPIYFSGVLGKMSALKEACFPKYASPDLDSRTLSLRFTAHVHLDNKSLANFQTLLRNSPLGQRDLPPGRLGGMPEKRSSFFQVEESRFRGRDAWESETSPFPNLGDLEFVVPDDDGRCFVPMTTVDEFVEGTPVVVGFFVYCWEAPEGKLFGGFSAGFKTELACLYRVGPPKVENLLSIALKPLFSWLGVYMIIVLLIS